VHLIELSGPVGLMLFLLPFGLFVATLVFAVRAVREAPGRPAGRWA
jgi:hypothetical protein